MVMASVTPTKSFFVDDVNSKQFFENLIQPLYQKLLIYTDFFKLAFKSGTTFSGTLRHDQEIEKGGWSTW